MVPDKENLRVTKASIADAEGSGEGRNWCCKMKCSSLLAPGRCNYNLSLQLQRGCISTSVCQKNVKVFPFLSSGVLQSCVCQIAINKTDICAQVISFILDQAFLLFPLLKEKKRKSTVSYYCRNSLEAHTSFFHL